MGNNIGSSVNKGITKELFQATLKANGVKADSDKFKKAMTIFDKYASIGGDANTLEEDEQVMARTEFDKLTKDDYKNGTSDFGKDKSAAEEYMKAMDHAASLSNDKAGEVTITNDGAVVAYGTTTEDTSDDVVRIYTKGEDGSYTVAEPEPETVPDEAPVEEEPAPEAPKTPTFKDNDALGNAVVRYLLGMEEDEAINAGIEYTGLTYSVNGETATVKYNEKEYTARFNPDGKLVFENDDDKSTLQQAVLNSESTDKEHHYYNRGRKGNLKSTYDSDKGEITNKSGTRRQGVSQEQTVASMLMNNNESTTLKLDGQIQENGTRKDLKGEDIIKTIDTSDDGSEKKITKSELLKFLSAAVKEANVTVDAAKPGAPGGSRIYAPDVDLDLKDLANIGIVFDKYAGDDKMLNAKELDALLADLKGKSMSKLAKEADNGKYEYVGPPKAPKKPERPKPEPPKEDKPFEMEYGDVAKADMIRGNVEGGSVAFQYTGGTKGQRTLVGTGADGKTHIVTNANIAEYEDHGLLGMDKKTFIVVQGLEPNVRAKVVSGKTDGPMILEIKDNNGNITYHQAVITYDGKNKTYSKGDKFYKNKSGQYITTAQLNSEGIKSLGIESGKDLKLPKGFSFDYDKKGKLICKFKGAEVTPKVAKVMIMKVNVPEKDKE